MKFADVSKTVFTGLTSIVLDLHFERCYISGCPDARGGPIFSRGCANDGRSQEWRTFPSRRDRVSHCGKRALIDLPAFLSIMLPQINRPPLRARIAGLNRVAKDILPFSQREIALCWVLQEAWENGREWGLAQAKDWMFIPSRNHFDFQRRLLVILRMPRFGAPRRKAR